MNNLIKKITSTLGLLLGTSTAVVIPIVSVVSCEDSSFDTSVSKDGYKFEYEVYDDNTIRIIRVTEPKNNLDTDSNVSLDLSDGVDGRKISVIGAGAFAGLKNVKSINLPDSIMLIGEKAFSDCQALEGIFKLPSNLLSIGPSAFKNSNLIIGFEINPSSKHFETIDNVLFAKKSYCIDSIITTNIARESYGKTLIQYPGGKEEESYEVPYDVVNIFSGAFAGNKHLKSINLNNVKNIGFVAFNDSNQIMQLNGGDEINYIADNSIKSTEWYVNKTSEIISIGKVLLKYRGLDTTLILEDFASICENAFDLNTTLRTLILNNIRYVEKNAFNGTTSLNTIKILNIEKTLEIGENAFDNAPISNIFVYADHFKMYHWMGNWTEYTDILSVLSTEISFNTGLDVNESNFTAIYGKGTRIPRPTNSKPGHYFAGWLLNGQIIEENLIWKYIDNQLVLDANWRII